jgi:hypothetical protein
METELLKVSATLGSWLRCARFDDEVPLAAPYVIYCQAHPVGLIAKFAESDDFATYRLTVGVGIRSEFYPVVSRGL